MFTSILLRLVTLWYRKVPPTGGIFFVAFIGKSSALHRTGHCFFC